ncbi:hypothetical protein PORY_002486 [Pneumocystis oryctolagi]|uniref:Uncharacterized protein n=1 Tax=Pneumocystis oryctolagi TaxID=42067 RepID=A0ACB7CCA7_9ASCO|nr:hypothetical protein PORY_002486 [Pneumocystis oryctolagi]
MYPGLMITSYIIHSFFHFLNYPINIRDICVFFAPAFSSLTALATYFLTKELKDETAGLFSAAFIAIVPGYISRSVSGSYDNEAIAITLLVTTFFSWIKAVKTGRAFWGSLTAFFYFYMVSSWGGYVFITNIIPLHCFFLILMGRFSSKLYVAYSSFYSLGTLMSMQIPFVGFQPIRTSEHMAALGIFGLMQILAFVNFVRFHTSDEKFKTLLKYSVFFVFFFSFAVLVLLTITGTIAPWTGRFYSLWDTNYARIHIPIIASVSEHQPTSWAYFYFDFGLLIWLFPAGVYLCFQKLQDEHVFVIIYAVMASYFSGVMVRLILVLAPIVCIASGLILSEFLDKYLFFSDFKVSPTSSESKIHESIMAYKKSLKDTGKAKLPVLNSIKGSTKNIAHKIIRSWISKLASVSLLFYYLVLFVYHSTWVTSGAYSSPSVVLSGQTSSGKELIIDDYREAYYWLRKNTPYDAKIMSWWDYGYQIGGLADRITLVDNNTWNNTHIATVGKIMSSSEEISYPILRKHDVDYILVIFGGLLGYSGDDINKFLWMIRIAEGVWPNEVNENSFYSHNGYRVDKDATPTMKNSLMYKMSYYNFNKLFNGNDAYDSVRGQHIPVNDISLNILEEAYTTENWLVRIYKVKSPDNLGRDHIKKKSSIPHKNTKGDMYLENIREIPEDYEEESTSDSEDQEYPVNHMKHDVDSWQIYNEKTKEMVHVEPTFGSAMKKKALEIDHAFSLISHWTQDLAYDFNCDNIYSEKHLKKMIMEHKEIDFKESVFFEDRNKEIMENIEKAILKEDEEERERIRKDIEEKQRQKILDENKKIQEKQNNESTEVLEGMTHFEEKMKNYEEKTCIDEKKIIDEKKTNTIITTDIVQFPVLESKRKDYIYDAMDRDIKLNVLKPVSENEVWRKFCFQNKRKITPKCGQLTNSKQQIARIVKDLEEIIIMSKEVAMTAIIKQAETEVTVNLYSAYPLAAVCVLLMSNHPDFVDILLSRFAKKCPYTIPYLKYNKNTEEGKKALGFYRFKNGNFEEEASYTERQCGIFAVFAAIMQTQHSPNYLPMNFGWTLLAKLLNEPPPSETVFAIISTFIDVAGNAFTKHYGLQADKLIRLAVNDWVGDNKGSNAARLRILGEEWVNQGKIGLKNGGVFEE